MDRKGVDYLLMRGTVTSLKGDVRCTDGVDIFVNPAQKNLKRIGEVSRSLRAALRICVRPADVSRRKRSVWYMPSRRKLFAFMGCPAKEKLEWLEKVNQEICHPKLRKK